MRTDNRDVAPVVNISVADIDVALDAIRAANGVVVRPRTDLPEFGLTMALFADTEGNVLGVYSSLAG